jgi:hypothetical protein
MNAASAGSSAWTRARWFVSISIVFVLQAGLLFAFYRRPQVVPPAPSPALSRSLAEGSDELLALNDPTFFILPHRLGFSGEAWIKVSRLEFQSADWSERPRLLAWTKQPPGEDFKQSVRSNALAGFQPLAFPEPDPMPEYSAVSPIATASTFRIEGPLKSRRLLTPLPLRSWTNADLLTNSVVQIQVDARGDTVSATLLAPAASHRTNDLFALELARTARFEPVEPKGPGRTKSFAPELTPGTIIFEWQTLPVPPTNAAAVGP